jgi:GT2 family glycosyltransferase
LFVDKPLVSIIILNYNGKHLLKGCLDSIKTSDYPNLEVVVIDNASADHSVELIKQNYPDVIVKELEQNYGFAYPNNFGASISHGEFLFFLNNDTKLEKNSISELVAEMSSNDNISIGQSLLIHEDGTVDSSGDFVTSQGITFSSKNKDVKSPIKILSAKGAAMIIRKSLFEEIGGFDEDYFISFEDVELGWRAAILGHSSYLIPSSVVYHLGGQTIGKISPLVTFHGVKNSLSLVTTHFETRYALKNILQLYLRFFLRFIGIHESDLDEKFTIDKISAMKGGIWYLKNFKYIWKKHNSINSNRKISTTQLEEWRLIT